MRDDDAEQPLDAAYDANVDAVDVGAVDVAATVEADGNGDDDFEDDFDLDDTDGAPTPVGPRRTSRRGAILGAAMLGFHQAMYGKQETETVIDIEVSGDPPNIDLDGLDEDLDAHRRMVGPPLDQIKSRREPSRPIRTARRTRRRH
jgi:hypothetical protein